MNGRLTAILVLAMLLCTQQLAWAAPPTEPIVTNRTHFRIPFKVESASLQRLNPKELQLYVSRDRGANWELAQRLAPEASKFEYQAQVDGEYWFAVKTLDGKGQLHPPVGQYETGLTVIVDTTAPLIELSLQQPSPGRVQLSWNAADANLDPSTLKIEYQQPGSAEWETVEVAPRATGQISWNVPRPGQVHVRAVISDSAKNVGRGQTQFAVAGGESPPPPKPKSGRRPPIADGNASPDLAARQVIPPPNPGFPSPSPRMSPPNTNPPNLGVATEPSPPPGDYQGPIIAPFGAPDPPQASSQASSDRQIQSRMVSGDPNARPEITREQWPNRPDTMVNSVSSNSAVQRRIVSSRRFQVGYAVDDVGPSGIGAVELFITQDNGHKWWKYGNDPDKRSPIDVEVPQDGEYGFAIRVRSGAGLAAEPPMPGELPAVVVSVDQTPPLVEILSAQQGQGANSNRIQIRWRVSDEHLASKPVCVYYASNRGGPWEPLGGWRDDNGVFEWTIGPGLPTQIFFRVSARDAAGNIGNAETVQPIVIDLVRPTARIVDVESPRALAPQ